MTYLLNGAQLAEAIATITEAVKGTVKPHFIPETAAHTDLLYYDTTSMMQHLLVSERTLHRYRKQGKIKFTVIGGKIYYPKDFLILPAENPDIIPTETAYCRPHFHQKVVLQSRERPRSKMIDLHRLHRLIGRCRGIHRKYSSTEVLRIRKLHQAARWEKGKDFHLWPKKIKFVSLPFRKLKKFLLDA